MGGQQTLSSEFRNTNVHDLRYLPLWKMDQWSDSVR